MKGYTHSDEHTENYHPTLQSILAEFGSLFGSLFLLSLTAAGTCFQLRNLTASYLHSPSEKVGDKLLNLVEQLKSQIILSGDQRRENIGLNCQSLSGGHKHDS